MKGAKTIRSEGQVDWSTIGTAVDYRLRYYFGVTPTEALTARLGAIMIEGAIVHGMLKVFNGADPELSGAKFEDMEALKDMIPRFFADLEGTLTRIQPEHRRLSRDDEELLARYCVVLAQFEQVYRRGRRMLQGTLLTVPDPVDATSELLARVPQTWLDDICALSWGFYDFHRELLSRTAVLNPNFDGSRDVRGADADLIVEGCLIDIKTSTQPKVTGDMLYQLLGYVLLDYSDKYRIREVGIYLARQQRMLRWSLVDLIGELSNGSGFPLNVLRDGFRGTVQD